MFSAEYFARLLRNPETSEVQVYDTGSRVWAVLSAVTRYWMAQGLVCLSGG
jgi:hypothetical protein